LIILRKYKLVRESQHGFVRNKSCLMNLLVFIDEVMNYLYSGYPVDIIYRKISYNMHSFDRSYLSQSGGAYCTYELIMLSVSR